MSLQCTPVEMTVKSDPRELEKVCTQVRNFAECVGLGERCARHLELVVDEICSNVICHAYQNKHDQFYHVRASVIDQEIVIQIIDHGQSFCFECVEKPDTSCELQDRSIGGLGLHFVKKLSDSAHYETLPSGENCFAIHKKLPASSAATG